MLDVLIIGAGPAGISAALSLNSAGANVRIVDEQSAAGGQVYRSVEQVSAQRPESLKLYGAEYEHGLVLTKALKGTPIKVSYETSVWDISLNDGINSVGLKNSDGVELINPRHIIIATGAMERPTPFPGWTLPGVMTVGAAQTLLKQSGLVPDANPVIVGTGPLVYLYITQMLAAGQKPALLLDTGPAFVPIALWSKLMQTLLVDHKSLLKGLGWLKDLKRSGINRKTCVESLRAIGKDALELIEYRCRGKTYRFPANLLLAHDGVIPNSHLAMAAGCRHRWNSLQKYWQPILDENWLSTQSEISIAGDSAGILGADLAQCTGRIVGWNVSQLLGLVDQARVGRETKEDKHKLNRISRMRNFLDHLYQPFDYFQKPEQGDTIVCRCENVSSDQIREVAAIGCMGPNQGKAFTRAGMGRCMGRQCGITVSQLIAEYHGKPVQEIGHYRIRPPIRPITVGDMANLAESEIA